MEHFEEEVRHWLRASDVLIARLQTGRDISTGEAAVVSGYLARVKGLLLTLKTYQALQASRDSIDSSKKS
jgi:hypothetical protein